MNLQNDKRINRVLMSVSDKTYLEDLARVFVQLGTEIIATGGTAAALKKVNIPYRTVEQFAQSPEVFGGRIKTLTFKLQSALLFDRNNPTHVNEAKDNQIEAIDCVVCNFYPFENKANENLSIEEMIEYIDIGGPTMVRSSAKNFSNVLVLTDPNDYEKVIMELKTKSGSVSYQTRLDMMKKAFKHVFQYDRAIDEYFSKQDLRYGENPQQKAYFVPSSKFSRIAWADTTGKVQLSYNNMLDTHAAFSTMVDAVQTATPKHGVVSIVKHNNPCGLASAPSLIEALERAWASDPVSSFGGVLAFSAPVTSECVRFLQKRFVEVICAPGFEEGVLEDLATHKQKVRIVHSKFNSEKEKDSERFERHSIEGGTLVQEMDAYSFEELHSVTKNKFPKEKMALSRFAIIAAKFTKSNAITLAYEHPDKGFQLISMGSGQPNRVDAIRRLTFPKAIENLEKQFGSQDKAKAIISECVMVSDAFFPFEDNVEEAHKFGVKYIIQPGGSIKDADVIACADRLNISMAFTGKRHFRH